MGRIGILQRVSCIKSDHQAECGDVMVLTDGVADIGINSGWDELMAPLGPNHQLSFRIR